MAYDGTTFSGTPAYSSGAAKFGSNGFASGAGVLKMAGVDSALSDSGADGGTMTNGTVECWVKHGTPSGLEVFIGHPNWLWIGAGADGFLTCRYGGAPEIGSATAAQICDDAWHHVAMVITGGACAVYVDGARIFNSATVGVTGADTTYGFNVGGFSGGFAWDGSIDELRVSDNARYSGSSFTAPTAAFTSDGHTIGLYHFEGDATNAAGSSPTAPGQVTGLGTTPGSSQVALAWTAPASDGGSSITDYTVEYRQTLVGGSWTAFSHSAGTGTSRTVTGLSNGTGYDFRVSAVNAIGTGTPSSTATGTPSGTPGSINTDDANLLFSPGNWDVNGTRALSINAGAYFKAVVTGDPSALTLKFDAASLLTPVPQIVYRVDDGPWTVEDVAATVDLAIPATNAWTSHTIEVVVKATTETRARWAGAATAVKFTGITVSPDTCTTIPVTARAVEVIVYGDSITEGVRTLNSDATNDTDRNDATQGWAWRLAEALGAEVGVVGFGAQGVLHVGNGSVPAFADAWDFIYSGVARDVTTSPPDLIVINQGHNDGGTDIVSAFTATLNAMLAATPAATRIAVMRPFSGNEATNLQAGIAACSAPGRVSYINTTGWFDTSLSSDGVHPFGVANVGAIAPLTAAALRTALGSGGNIKYWDGSAWVAAVA